VFEGSGISLSGQKWPTAMTEGCCRLPQDAPRVRGSDAHSGHDHTFSLTSRPTPVGVRSLDDGRLRPQTTARR